MKIIRREQQPIDYFNTMVNQFLNPLNFDKGIALDNDLWSPAVDITENKKNYMVTADLPGVEKNDIHVSLENSTLTIKGERKYENKEEGEGFSRVERIQGQFFRRFALPEATDESKIKAKYKKGVLEITIPKKANGKTKPVEVRIED